MIVVTGATGHIGNVLVRELVSRGEEVRALILPSEDTVPLEGLCAERVEGDVLDEGSLARAFKGASAVYHLAGIVAIRPGQNELMHRVNGVGTRNVAQACLTCGVKRLVYTSSIHALVEPEQGTVIDETCPVDPDRLTIEYSKSKARATLGILEAVERGLDAVVVCPTGVIGPYDYRVSEVGQLILDFGRGRMKASIDGAYDFVDVRDVATGHILAFEKGRSGEEYILSGARMTVDELLAVLEEATGVGAPSWKAPLWAAQGIAVLAPLYSAITNGRVLFSRDMIATLTGNSFISSEKARRELGYSSRPPKQSLIESVRWFRDAGML